jgi:hypothetical protein
MFSGARALRADAAAAVTATTTAVPTTSGMKKRCLRRSFTSPLQMFVRRYD